MRNSSAIHRRLGAPMARDDALWGRGCRYTPGQEVAEGIEGSFREGRSSKSRGEPL